MKSGCHNVTLNLTKKTRQHSWFSLQIGGKKRSTYCNLFQPPPISYSSSSPVRKMIEEYVLFCITMVFCSGHKLLTKNVPLWLKLTLAALSREPSFSPLLSCLLQWLWWWAQKKPQSAKFALLRSNQIPIWTWLELRGEVYLTPRMTLDAFCRNFS